MSIIHIEAGSMKQEACQSALHFVLSHLPQADSVKLHTPYSILHHSVVRLQGGY